MMMAVEDGLGVQPLDFLGERGKQNIYHWAALPCTSNFW
jgi:hypothetical protein